LIFQAERKRYEKETEKYYSSLEKLLNMSAKKKEPQLQEVLYISFFPHTWMCNANYFNECWFSSYPLGKK